MVGKPRKMVGENMKKKLLNERNINNRAILLIGANITIYGGK